MPPSVRMASPAPLVDSSTIGAPAVRIRVVAHASPRWRGARDAEEADRRNLELSQRRAAAVMQEIEARLERHLGPFALISSRDAGTSSRLAVELTSEVRPGETATISEHRGSLDSLAQAGGRRSNDDAQFRRVDVIVEWARKTTGQVVARRKPLMEPTLSRNWKLSIDTTAGASAGAAYTYLSLRLINARSGQTMTGGVHAFGGGPKASIGASQGIWSDPTPFTTDEPMLFADFEGNVIRYTCFSVSVFIGYEWSRFSFSGLGDGAKDIDVGGANVGTAGIGGAPTTGVLHLDGPYPPTDIPIPGSDRFLRRYESTRGGDDQCRLHFASGSAMLTSSEIAELEAFLASTLSVI